MTVENAIKEGVLLLPSFRENYLRTVEVQKNHLRIPTLEENPLEIVEKLKEKLVDSDLFFPDTNILEEIVAALAQGNVIIQGAPGTGKTSLVKELCNIFQVSYDLVTALPHWSHFDTVGGIYPSTNPEGQEVFLEKNGCVLESVLKCCDVIRHNELHQEEKLEKLKQGERQAHWLVVDEMNRGEMDKMFGALFTTLGSNEEENRKISIPFTQNPDKEVIFVPNNYRIIGLMNHVDQNYIFSMSQALARRFTIVTLPKPVEDYFEEEWDCCYKKVINMMKEKVVVSKPFESTVKELFSPDLQEEHPSITQFKQFLTYLRYKNPEKPYYVGLEFGFALMQDCLEFCLMRLLFSGYLVEEETKQKEILDNILDSAVFSRIIPQISEFDREKMEALCGLEGLECFKRCRQAFLEAME